MGAFSNSISKRLRILMFVQIFPLALLRAKIWGLDLSMVKAKLMSKRNENMSGEQADAAVEAYRRYLLLAAVAKFPVVPTQESDAAWHHHILHTKAYVRDCRDIFGCYLHHQPAIEDGPTEEREALQKYFRKTAELYRALFGENYIQIQRLIALDGTCSCPQQQCSNHCDCDRHCVRPDPRCGAQPTVHADGARHGGCFGQYQDMTLHGECVGEGVECGALCSDLTPTVTNQR
jgi:hypothetical protein